MLTEYTKHVTKREERLAIFQMAIGNYAVCRSLGFNLEDALIMMTIGLGRAQGRPFNLTSLANYLDLSRAKVSRRVAIMEHKGYVMSQRHGARLCLVTTDRFMTMTEASVDLMSRNVLRAADEIRRAQSKSGKTSSSSVSKSSKFSMIS